MPVVSMSWLRLPDVQRVRVPLRGPEVPALVGSPSLVFPCAVPSETRMMMKENWGE